MAGAPKFVVPHVIDFDPQLREAMLTLESHLSVISESGGGAGTTILTGAGPPLGSTGNEGDFYIDTATDIMYGPKGATSVGPEYSVMTATTFTDDGSSSYSLGLKFRVTAGGLVGAKAWCAPANAGTALNSWIISLWDTTTSTLTFQYTMTTPLVAGQWNTVRFPTPTPLVAGRVYVMCLYNPTGAHRSSQSWPAVTSPTLDSGPLHMLYSGEVGPNGVFDPLPNVYPANNWAGNSPGISPIIQTAATATWPVALEGGGSGGGTAVKEVNVSTAGPSPRASELLWVDTDAPAPPSGGGGSLPAGGTAGQSLIKNSATDGDASWAATAVRFVQVSAAAVWTITHGLGFRPNVAIVDSTGREVYAEIDYLSATSVRLNFSAGVAGEAYLS